MPPFPPSDPDHLRRRLEPPSGLVRVVIDTDCANEIDDQFALAWALLRPDRLRVEAVTAEPFSFRHHLPGLRAAEAALDGGGVADEALVGGFQGWARRLRDQGRRVDDLRLVGPEEGMELSHAEILRVVGHLGGRPGLPVLRGAPRYMAGPGDVVRSEAAEAIVDIAKSGSGDDPLYVAALGCVTNVAAALLMAPEIARDLVVVWTSSYPSTAPHSNRPSLNLVQDLPASRLLFDSGVPLVYIPGYQVGAQLRVSLPEIESFVRGRGAIGDYLHHLFTHNPLHAMFGLSDTGRRTWTIWDLICIAWLLEPSWVPTHLAPSPVLGDDLHWHQAPGRHLIREAHDVQRDEIFLDLYDRVDTLR